MDNSQKFDISLGAPLEQSVEDALVNIATPTFAYNTQMPVGGIMSNSVKFEDDGYISGWYRYQFFIDGFFVGTTNYPDGQTTVKDFKVLGTKQAYLITFWDDTQVMLSAGWQQELMGTMTQIRILDLELAFNVSTGATHTNYQIIINPYTLEILNVGQPGYPPDQLYNVFITPSRDYLNTLNVIYKAGGAVSMVIREAKLWDRGPMSNLELVGSSWDLNDRYRWTFTGNNSWIEQRVWGGYNSTPDGAQALASDSTIAFGPGTGLMLQAQPTATIPPIPHQKRYIRQWKDNMPVGQPDWTPGQPNTSEWVTPPPVLTDPAADPRAKVDTLIERLKVSPSVSATWSYLVTPELHRMGIYTTLVVTFGSYQDKNLQDYGWTYLEYEKVNNCQLRLTLIAPTLGEDQFMLGPGDVDILSNINPMPPPSYVQQISEIKLANGTMLPISFYTKSFSGSQNTLPRGDFPVAQFTESNPVGDVEPGEPPPELPPITTQLNGGEIAIVKSTWNDVTSLPTPLNQLPTVWEYALQPTPTIQLLDQSLVATWVDPTVVSGPNSVELVWDLEETNQWLPVPGDRVTIKVIDTQSTVAKEVYITTPTPTIGPPPEPLTITLVDGQDGLQIKRERKYRFAVYIEGEETVAGVARRHSEARYVVTEDALVVYDTPSDPTQGTDPEPEFWAVGVTTVQGSLAGDSRNVTTNWSWDRAQRLKPLTMSNPSLPTPGQIPDPFWPAYIPTVPAPTDVNPAFDPASDPVNPMGPDDPPAPEDGYSEWPFHGWEYVKLETTENPGYVTGSTPIWNDIPPYESWEFLPQGGSAQGATPWMPWEDSGPAPNIYTGPTVKLTGVTAVKNANEDGYTLQWAYTPIPYVPNPADPSGPMILPPDYMQLTYLLIAYNDDAGIVQQLVIELNPQPADDSNPWDPGTPSEVQLVGVSAGRGVFRYAIVPCTEPRPSSDPIVNGQAIYLLNDTVVGECNLTAFPVDTAYPGKVILEWCDINSPIATPEHREYLCTGMVPTAWPTTTTVQYLVNAEYHYKMWTEGRGTAPSYKNIMTGQFMLDIITLPQVVIPENSRQDMGAWSLRSDLRPLLVGPGWYGGDPANEFAVSVQYTALYSVYGVGGSDETAVTNPKVWGAWEGPIWTFASSLIKMKINQVRFSLSPGLTRGFYVWGDQDVPAPPAGNFFGQRYWRDGGWNEDPKVASKSIRVYGPYQSIQSLVRYNTGIQQVQSDIYLDGWEFGGRSFFLSAQGVNQLFGAKARLVLKSTITPVEEVTDEQRVARGHIYIVTNYSPYFTRWSPSRFGEGVVEVENAVLANMDIDLSSFNALRPRGHVSWLHSQGDSILSQVVTPIPVGQYEVMTATGQMLTSSVGMGITGYRHNYWIQLEGGLPMLCMQLVAGNEYYGGWNQHSTIVKYPPLVLLTSTGQFLVTYNPHYFIWRNRGVYCYTGGSCNAIPITLKTGGNLFRKEWNENVQQMVLVQYEADDMRLNMSDAFPDCTVSNLIPRSIFADLKMANLITATASNLDEGAMSWTLQVQPLLEDGYFPVSFTGLQINVGSSENVDVLVLSVTTQVIENEVPSLITSSINCSYLSTKAYWISRIEPNGQFQIGPLRYNSSSFVSQPFILNSSGVYNIPVSMLITTGQLMSEMRFNIRYEDLSIVPMAITPPSPVTFIPQPADSGLMLWSSTGLEVVPPPMNIVNDQAKTVTPGTWNILMWDRTGYELSLLRSVWDESRMAGQLVMTAMNMQVIEEMQNYSVTIRDTTTNQVFQAQINEVAASTTNPRYTVDLVNFIPVRTEYFGLTKLLIEVIITAADNVNVEFTPQGIFQRSTEDVQWLATYVIGNTLRTQFVKAGSLSTYYVNIDTEQSFSNLGAAIMDLRTGVEVEKFIGPLNDLQCWFTRPSDRFDLVYYYYIDKTHVLAQFDDEFEVHYNPNPMDEKGWKVMVTGGVEERIERYRLVEGNGYYKVGMTSCKDGGLPFIWMLGWTDNNSSGVRIRWARWTSSCRFESLQWFQAQVNVVGMIGGGTYPANGLTVLGSSGMSASVFCSSCTITSYNESTNVFIGFKMSKGLNQWTVQLNGAAAAKVIHGYGSIGPNGVISGAPVPSALVTERGFAPTTLYIGIAQGISGRCILVGSKVFFLVTSIGGVKCHLTVEAGTVTPGATIPLSSVVSTSTGSWGTAGQSGGTRSGQGTILGVHTSGAAQHYWAGVGAWSSSIAATCSSVWYSSVEDNSDLVAKVSTLNRSYVSASDGFGYLSIKVFAATFDGLSIGYDSRNGVSLAKDGKKIDPSAIGESIAQGIEDIKNNGIDYSIGTGGSTFDITEASKTAVEAEESGKSKDNATWEGVAAGFSGAKEAFGDLSRTISQLPDVTTAASATIPLKFFYCISDDCRVEAGPGFYDAQFCNSMYMQAESDNGVREVGSDMTLDLFPNVNGGGMAGPAGVGVWAGVNINVVINASDLGATNNQVHIVQNPIQVGQRHIYVTYPHENVMTHSITNNVLSIAPQQRDYSTSIGVRNPSFRLVEFSNTNTAQSLSGRFGVMQGVTSLLEGGERLGVPVQVDTGYPVFSPMGIHDYCWDTSVRLNVSGIAGSVYQVSVHDTVVMDGMPSNVIVTMKGEVLLASNYCHVYVKDYQNIEELRPKVFTADTISLNLTGSNLLKDGKAFHGFDGYTNRIQSLIGGTGIDSETINQIYTQVENDAFKVASIAPPTQVLGKLSSVPIIPYPHKVNIYSKYLKNMSLANENLFATRYAIPQTAEVLQRVPAFVRTKASYKLNVINGVTSFTTGTRNSSDQVIPAEQDFVIYGTTYRLTEDWINKVEVTRGVAVAQPIAATVGLTFIGSTPKVGWLFSTTNREFFNFSGSDTLVSVGTGFRFRNVVDGRWDLVAQEIIFRSKLERDLDTMIRVSDGFTGMMYKPNETIGEYEYYSLAAGLVLQGVYRVQAHRFVIHDYMEDKPNISIPSNLGKWKKIRGDSIEDFYSERTYIGFPKIRGYFHEPFKLATTFLGLEDRSECKFEWVINFGLTDVMRRILGDRYVQVNIAAETVTVGGNVKSEVSHCYLKADMFTRHSDYGYYTYRFHSNNGIGSQEKLFIWSDGIMALRSLTCEVVKVSEARHAPMVTRPDITGLVEF